MDGPETSMLPNLDCVQTLQDGSGDKSAESSQIVLPPIFASINGDETVKQQCFPEISNGAVPNVEVSSPPPQISTESQSNSGLHLNGIPNGSPTTDVTDSQSPVSKAISGRPRVSMLPKPEVGPKPSHLRMSPVKRQLPVPISGPMSLNIMTTSLPSPVALSTTPTAPNECPDGTRNVWGHRGSFSEAVGSSGGSSCRLSPGSVGSCGSAGSSGAGTPVKTHSPPSPNSKIPCATNRLYQNHEGLMTQSLVLHQQQLDASLTPKCSRHSATGTDNASPTRTSGNLSKLTAKASGTASMLRSTLRRMTRLAVSASGQSGDKQQQQLTPGTPSPVRGISPRQELVNMATGSPVPPTRKLLTSKALSPPAVASAVTSMAAAGSNIQRSRSFRDAVGSGTDTLGTRSTGPSSISSVHQYRSSSLRRSHRNKDIPLQQQHQQGTGGSQTLRASIGLQRSGTGGTLDRTSVRRSNSTAGPSNRSRVRDQHNVRKSRGCQTLLTKDTYLDDAADLDSMNPSSVEFTVYLPDLLGSGGGNNEDVETMIIEPSEPIDIRRNRQLTLDNMRLNRELEKVKQQLADTEVIKRDLKTARIKLEEEQRTRIRIEQQLDQHNEKVLLIAQSMDRVEREFESRDAHIATLETKLAKAEADLKASNDVINTQRTEIAQALTLQKTLLMQYQESEIESKELHEFLQAEKYTLAETLKDCESEMLAFKAEIERKAAEVLAAEERCGHLVRLGEQRNQEVKMLQAQLKGLEETARSTILAQGAELATAHAVLSELLIKLQSEYPGSSDAISSKAVKTCDSNKTGNGPPEVQKQQLTLNSEVNKNGGGGSEDDLLPECLLNDPTLQNLSEAIMKRQKSEELVSNGLAGLGLTDPATINEDDLSLEAKLELLKSLLESLMTDLKKRDNMVVSHSNGCNGDASPKLVSEQPTNGKPLSSNGHSNGHPDAGVKNEVNTSIDPEVFDLNGSILDDPEKKEEIISKFLRHRKILLSNYEQAEQEIKRVDEIFHETVNHVIKVLDSLPPDTRTLPPLVQLKNYLEDEETAESSKSLKWSQHQSNNTTSNGSKASINSGMIIPEVPLTKKSILKMTDTDVTPPPALNQSL